MFDSIATHAPAAIRIDLTGLRSLCAEARRLIAEGADPGTLAHAHRGDMLCLPVRTLGFWAEREVSEGASHSARFVRHRDRPRA